MACCKFYWHDAYVLAVLRLHVTSPKHHAIFFIHVIGPVTPGWALIYISSVKGHDKEMCLQNARKTTKWGCQIYHGGEGIPQHGGSRRRCPLLSCHPSNLWRWYNNKEGLKSYNLRRPGGKEMFLQIFGAEASHMYPQQNWKTTLVSCGSAFMAINGLSAA